MIKVETLNREFHYRAFDIQEKKMHVVNSIVFGSPPQVDVEGYGLMAPDRTIITEWTGCCDSKGSMIFEGDILVNAEHDDDVYYDPILKKEIPFKRWLIDFKKGHYRARALWSSKKNPVEFKHSVYYTIIGNMFETPHLVSTTPTL